MPQKEVLSHFREDRNLSLRFVGLCEVLCIVSTNLLMFMQSLCLGLLFLRKFVIPFRRFPLLNMLSKMLRTTNLEGLSKHSVNYTQHILGKTQREIKTLLFLYYRTLTLLAQRSMREQRVAAVWPSQQVLVSEAG